MGMGSLATGRRKSRPILTPSCVLDNEVYGETGRAQASHTATTVDSGRRRPGMRDIRCPRSPPWLTSKPLLRPCRTFQAGRALASIKIDGANLERVPSSRDGQLYRDAHPRRRTGFRPNLRRKLSWCTAAGNLDFVR